MQLRKTQKNELFDLIEQYELAPSMFDFSYNPYTLTTEISYMGEKEEYIDDNDENEDEEGYEEPDRYKYSFRLSKDNVYVCPGNESLYYNSTWINWQQVVTYFRMWLRNLEQEISVDDKWEQLQQEIEALNVDFSIENEKFTHKEYQEIERRINLLKEEVAKIPDFQEHLENINQKLDHLTEMVENLGKFDWRGLFVGTVVNIATTIGVSPESAQMFKDAIKRVFSNYFLP